MLVKDTHVNKRKRQRMLSIAILLINQLLLILFIINQTRENKRLNESAIARLEEYYLAELTRIRADIEKYVVENNE